MTVFNKTEQEAIVLNAVWRMIDDMVNYEIFVKNEPTQNTNLMFNTYTHQRLFNILLGDFLSQPQRRNKNTVPFNLPRPPSNARLSDLTYLFYLREICEDPKLGADADLVRDQLESFSTWLEAEALVENVWFPSIETESDIRTQRIVFLKICGDIAKHNFARLEVNVKKIHRILKDNGHTIDEGEGYLVLPDFYEWFGNHVFSYHASIIAEFLNNIRWAIFEYLQPEFERSFERVDPEPMYRFQYPADITQPVAKVMYWELMNMVRSRPYFPRFTVNDFLKSRY